MGQRRGQRIGFVLSALACAALLYLLWAATP